MRGRGKKIHRHRGSRLPVKLARYSTSQSSPSPSINTFFGSFVSPFLLGIFHSKYAGVHFSSLPLVLLLLSGRNPPSVRIAHSLPAATSTASLPSPLQYLTQQQTPPYCLPQQLLYPLLSLLTGSPTFAPSSAKRRAIASPNCPPAVARLCLSAGRTTGSDHSIYSSPLPRAAEFASPLLFSILHKLSCASTRQHHVFSHHECSLIVKL